MKLILLTIAALCVANSVCQAKSLTKTDIIDDDTEREFEHLKTLIKAVQKTIIGQIDRVQLPLSYVQRLGYSVHVTPFTNEEKISLEPYLHYLRTVYVARDQVLSWLSAFSEERFLRYSIGIPAYQLSEEERLTAKNIIENAIDKVKVNYDAINNIFAQPAVKSNLDKIEKNKDELSQIIGELTTSLKGAFLQNTKKEDIEKVAELKSKNVEKIAEISSSLVDLSESMEIMDMMGEIAMNINEIAETLKELPLNLNMIYML